MKNVDQIPSDHALTFTETGMTVIYGGRENEHTSENQDTKAQAYRAQVERGAAGPPTKYELPLGRSRRILPRKQAFAGL